MPRCIAPGCTSGYDSNSEKLHFFYVPKDNDLAAKWQAALRRRNFVTKPRQPVCEKHFIKGDILWFKEFFDLQGAVVARARYIRPRLRPGAVPVLFPWYEPPLVSESPPAPLKQLEETKIEVKEETEHLVPSCCEGSSILPTIQETGESRLTPENEEEKDESPSSPASNEIIPLHKVLEDDDVLLPRSWTKNIVAYGDVRVPWFTQSTCVEENGTYSPMILKELYLQPNMEARVQVLGVRIDPESFGLERIIESKEAVERTLSHLNVLNVCCGCPLPDDLKNMKCDTVYKDTRGSLRHVACTMLSKPIQCNFCAKVRRTLVKRRYWLKNRDAKRLERIRLMKLSPEQREKAKKMHRILRTRKNGGNDDSKLKIKISGFTEGEDRRS